MMVAQVILKLILYGLKLVLRKWIKNDNNSTDITFRNFRNHLHCIKTMRGDFLGVVVSIITNLFTFTAYVNHYFYCINDLRYCRFFRRNNNMGLDIKMINKTQKTPMKKSRKRKK
jgi:Na+/alanine symporter